MPLTLEEAKEHIEHIKHSMPAAWSDAVTELIDLYEVKLKSESVQEEDEIKITDAWKLTDNWWTSSPAASYGCALQTPTGEKANVVWHPEKGWKIREEV